MPDSEFDVLYDDLDSFIGIMPPDIKAVLEQDGVKDELIEVVMDLGRLPEAWLTQGRRRVLREEAVTSEELLQVSAQLASFGDDNRAGIERTLHRISALRNRSGEIVGLTCRVGRAVAGGMRLIEELIATGNSVLLLGKPGVGKTTMLREVARWLADERGKRVVIVDTSNEIAGDGDMPHPAIGRARRMQVARTDLQHHIMIEAVENHMPEVIVIDEMSSEQEALAARTIAERGVQLIATAHGTKLTNVIANPTLADLIGGINTVTLGDEEAQRRRTQKTVLERKHAPTFPVVVEIHGHGEVLVHKDVANTVDRLLRGEPVTAWRHKLTADGEVERDEEAVGSLENARGGERPRVPRTRSAPKRSEMGSAPTPTQKLYCFGISKPKIARASELTGIDVKVVDDMDLADLFLTDKSHYKRGISQVQAAEHAGIPVHILRRASEERLAQFLRRVPQRRSFSSRRGNNILPHERSQALKEVRSGALRILEGEKQIELEPRGARLRRIQHELANRYGVNSESSGEEPNRRVLLYDL